jgi:hypothetical protein
VIVGRRNGMLVKPGWEGIIGDRRLFFMSRVLEIFKFQKNGTETRPGSLPACDGNWRPWGVGGKAVEEKGDWIIGGVAADR